MTLMDSCLFDVKLLEAESVIGKSHTAAGLPNQDAVRIIRLENGNILVIADGVGSETHAELASQAAAEAVIEVLCSVDAGMLAEEDIAEMLCGTFRKHLAAKCTQRAATTCIFCAHLFRKGIFLGQIGDGICCGYQNGSPFVLAEKNADFANVVVPLTSDCPPERWKILKLGATEELELMLATDGVADDILPGKEADFAHHLINALEAEPVSNRKTALKSILDHWETPMSFDDKTIALYHFVSSGRKMT